MYTFPIEYTINIQIENSFTGRKGFVLMVKCKDGPHTLSDSRVGAGVTRNPPAEGFPSEDPLVHHRVVPQVDVHTVLTTAADS